MAITRSQIAKQLLANGGRIGLKGGADASQFNVRRESQSVPNVSAGGASFNDLGPAPDRKDRQRNKEAFETGVGISNLERLENEGVSKVNFPGVLGLGLNVLAPLRNISLKKNIDRYKRTTTGPYTLEGYKEYMQSMRDRFTPDDDNDSDPIFIPQDMMAEAPSIMDQETEVEEDPFKISRRFAAEGGIMNSDVVGGEMDFDSARQMYGLGKLVKKIGRSIKKVAKSPIGKAALLGLGAYGLGGGTLFGKTLPGVGTGGGFSFRNILPNLMGVKETGGVGQGFEGILGKIGLTKGGGSLMPTIGGGIAAASAIAGMLTPEQEAEAQQIADETGIAIETIRANPNEYLGRRFRAEGGSMDEPVAKKTMPLLDMDGQEMDLRAEGGFVPIGRMEKADDVPARLSKNEFVFTADAVRNAGEGDVDKGAEVMYNMMKNLESGGEVSEESQGLEGAREMFQTSQRLEEVI